MYGPNSLQDLEDHTEMNFSDKLETVIFGKVVPIAQIRQTQERVYEDCEVDKLLQCEEVLFEVPHFPLAKMNFGHPKYNGESNYSKTVEEHVKAHVGNHKLIGINGEPIDENSLQEVQAHISSLEEAGRVQPSEYRMAKKWEKPKLIQPDSKWIRKEALTKAKYFDQCTKFKEWVQVTNPISSLVLIFDMGISNAWRIVAMPVP